MIKKIFIHIGVHKTASTSIQQVLGMNSDLLETNGMLYPKFNFTNKDIFNHSIPFYGMFCDAPEKYHANLKNGSHNKVNLQELHQRFTNQFVTQVEQFDGDTLILSGEDISGLKIAQLAKFKEYLIKVTGNDIEFKVIIFCRHPVHWLRSSVTSRVFGGQNLDHATAINKGSFSNYYRLIVENFSNVFGISNIIARRFEDAINAEHGPTQILLDICSDRKISCSQFSNKVQNKSSSYESLKLLDSFNTEYPVNIQNVHNAEVSRPNKMLFRNIPGTRFTLDKDILELYWDNTKKDLEWFCETFSLPKYVKSFEMTMNISDTWDFKTIEYIRTILYKQSTKTQELILRTIYKEFGYYKKHYSTEKIQMLQSFFENNANLIQNQTNVEHHYSNKYWGGSFSIKKNIHYLKKLKSNIFNLGGFEDKKLYPVVKVTNDFICQKSIFKNQIADVKLNKTGIGFSSTGNDPYFILPEINTPKRVKIVRIDITVPKSTVLQIFYKTKQDTNYCVKQSVKSNLNQGRNIINLEIPTDQIIGRMRIDPGVHPGHYVLHKLELLGYNFF
jgi:hypothetical protein